MSLKRFVKQQYEYAKQRGWIAHFIQAGAKFDFSPADLMAIASRESNMSNIKGDFHDGMHHGFSLMQLDIDSHRAWIESGAWKNAEAAILKGAEALAEKRNQILRSSKQSTATVRFRSGKTVKFTPRQLTPEALRHCTLAAYNCGGAAYYHYSIGNDIDRGTTQKNYGRDVMTRAEIFQELLNADNPAPAAPSAVRDVDAESEQEPAESQAENSAIVSAETGTDLLGAAVPKAKAVAPKLWPRVAGWLGYLYALYEANKVIGSVIVLLILIGIGIVIHWQWARIKPHVLKFLR